MKYRKRPIPAIEGVEAIQFVGLNFNERVIEFGATPFPKEIDGKVRFCIKGIPFEQGDWIVRVGPKNYERSYEVMTNEVFQMLYEPSEE